MWLARMNRSKASGPPCSDSGALRTVSASSSLRILAPASLVWAGVGVEGSAIVGSIAVESYCPAMIAPAMSDSTLAQRLLDGDRRALARAITLVEDDRPEGWELVKEVY